MTTTNDITGDLIKSKQASEDYRDGWDRIFGNKRLPDTPADSIVPDIGSPVPDSMNADGSIYRPEPENYGGTD
jgi:hypothetical protein